MEPKGMTAVLEANRLLIDVSELLRNPGTTKPLRTTEEVPGLDTVLAHVGSRPVTFDLSLHAIVEGVLVTGALSARARLECRRCLNEFDENVTVPVEAVYVTGPGLVDDYRVVAEQIDLEPMARDEIVLALPLNPLCRPDCKGLCAVCGQNLNEADCGHSSQQADVRWEPLRRLMDQMGE